MIKIIILSLPVLYAIFLVYGLIGYLRSGFFISKKKSAHKTNTTIIVCARNEEKYIDACLRSILEQHFDKSLLEIILVNDASEDTTLQKSQTVLLNSGIKYQIISNPTKAGKKRSLAKAIAASNGELIITRDADTYTISSDWLSSMVSFYEETGSEFIIAPVEIENDAGLISQLQRFETGALSILTAGYALNHSAFLCNGANLAFSKSIFNKVGGYQKHEHIASGDDVLFLEEVKKIAPEKVGYIKQKSAAVMTYPVHGFKNLVSQKIRWTKKVNANPNFLNLVMGLTIFFVHALTLFFIFRAVFVWRIPLLGLIFICSRFFIDFLLLFLGSGYFNKPVKWLWFLPLGLIYSVYVVLIGLLSLFVKPNWK